MTSRQSTALRKKPRKGAKKPVKPTNKKFGKRFAVLRSRAVATLATNVRRLREERELSQSDLGAAIGKDQQAIGLIEGKRANPTLLTVEKIAKALKTTAPDLLTAPARGRI